METNILDALTEEKDRVKISCCVIKPLELTPQYVEIMSQLETLKLKLLLSSHTPKVCEICLNTGLHNEHHHSESTPIRSKNNSTNNVVGEMIIVHFVV